MDDAAEVMQGEKGREEKRSEDERREGKDKKRKRHHEKRRDEGTGKEYESSQSLAWAYHNTTCSAHMNREIPASSKGGNPRKT